MKNELIDSVSKRGSCYFSKILHMAIVLLLFLFVEESSANLILEKSKLNLDLKQTSLNDVFEEIETQTDYSLFYSVDELDLTTEVELSDDSKDLDNVLVQLEDQTGYIFTIVDDKIIVKSPKETNTLNVQNEGVIITGKVLDSTTKEILIGVTILVKGVDGGTVTDINGNFSISVPYSEATLVLSYIGYQPNEVKLQGDTDILVEMVEDSKALEEVMVVGYTQQRMETMVGAVDMITTKDLQQSPTANINNALAGRLPGLIATQFSGGEPGVDRASILIRGKATFNNQSPIVIVDGVERSMDYLSADEIETFTILKDAASTAQYGIRGANGVIVITTKRGQPNEKASVNFKASYGVNTAVKYPEYLGSADYATLYNEAMVNDAKMRGLSESDISNLNLFSQDAIDEFRRGEGYNWDYYDYTFTTAPQQDYTLSIRGGSDKASYYVMANYFSQGTNLKYTDESLTGRDSKFDRYNIRSNIDININDNFWAKFDISGRITDRTSPGTSASKLMLIANTQPPYLPITLDYNGNTDNDQIFVDNPEGVLFGTQTYRYNILGELSRTGYQTEKQTYFEGSIALGHKLDFITKGLSIDAMFAYDFNGGMWLRRDVEYYTEGFRQYPGYATFEPIDGAGVDIYMDPAVSSQYQGAYGGGNKYEMDSNPRNSHSNNDQRSKYYTQLKLDYSRTFNTLHAVSAMMLVNRQEQRIGQDPYYRHQGLTGRASYYYDHKYLAEFNFGYNGSENFAKGNRYGFFPSASAGWVISSEDFMTGTQSWLDFLKLRVSYGLVGSDNLVGTRWGYLSFYQGGDSYNFGPNFDNNVGGVSEARFANPDLSWEKAKKLNVGIDFTLFKQRLSVSVDYFKEHRFDILTNLSTSPGADIQRIDYPDIVGKSSPYVNLGEVDNKGFDFEINWTDNIGRNFRYFIRPNFTFARNTIIETNEIDWGENTWRKATGNPLDSHYLYQFDHFVANQDEADALNASQIQGQWGQLIPGDVVYKDLNNDGVVDDKDRAVTGYSRSPEIMYGIPITMQFKNLDFNVLFQGSARTSLNLNGAAVYDFPSFDQDKIGKVKPYHLENRWTPETAETAKYPALHIGRHDNNKNSNSSLYLYNASYVRLKNVEIGYSLPSNFIRKIKFEQIRFYVQGLNLFTWDNLDDVDVDPETSSDGTWYPIQRTINVGVNLTF